MNEKLLHDAVAEGLSIRQLQKRFTMSNGSIRYWLSKFNLKTNGNNEQTKWSKELIESVLIDSGSISDMLRKIGLTTCSGNFQTLQKYAKVHNIILPQYNGQLGNRWGRIVKDEEAFCINSTVSRGIVKKRLINEGRGNKCELCGHGNMWRGKTLIMVLDHTNGVNNDNRRENLRFLCPNCNSTLDTHCGKNRSKSV